MGPSDILQRAPPKYRTMFFMNHTKVSRHCTYVLQVGSVNRNHLVYNKLTYLLLYLFPTDRVPTMLLT